MKNLHVLQTEKLEKDVVIVGHCVDADNGRLLVVTNTLRVHEIKESGNVLLDQKLDRQESGLPSTISPEDVILTEFVVESGCILLVLRCGKFVRIGVSSFSPPSSCFYEYHKSLSSTRLSPDQDLIALADEDNGIHILSSDCSSICSSNALTMNDSVNKPVGVGWGSKETQFFGLDGRPSKEKQTENKIVIDDLELANISKIETCHLFKQSRKRLERSTVLDWRGDGQYLASLTYITKTEKHYLKVWNRNLDLQYMSEQLVTMERGLISWIPNGQYVCCAQRRDNRINEIAMFEKNGMVHQRVTLPIFVPHLYITDLLWSPDSKILAVIAAQFELTLDAKESVRHLLMLFTNQNFQYYLKYSSYLTGDASQFSLRWNPISHNILYISSADGHCYEYNCTFVVDQCFTDSTVAVIDSQKLLITPFKICNIPPPMSAIVIEFNTMITRLIMDHLSLDKIFVLTSDNRLYYKAESEVSGYPVISPEINTVKIKSFIDNFGKFASVDFKDGDKYQIFMPTGQNSLLATRQHGSCCSLELIEITTTGINKCIVKSFANQQVVSMMRDTQEGNAIDGVVLLFEDWTFARFNLGSKLIETKSDLGVANERLLIREAHYDGQYKAVFSLTLDQTLRVNDLTIVSGCCTSFKLSENFLIYTTTENMIHFLPLDRVTIRDEQFDLGAWNQPIENGASLVMVCEDESKVILQMPRGNLEILHPRIMILLRLTQYIDSCDYLEAMKLARKYRVDLNFICDYMLRCDEHKFYDEKLNVFANIVASHDPSLLNLFVAELSPIDTLQGRYNSAMTYLPGKEGSKLNLKEVITGKGKVNDICSALKLPQDNHYLQPRLLCLLKQEPKKTSDALLLIHAIPSEEEKDAALKFILYFVPVEQLFLDAISTYDTDIALMVASASSKDPKEYLALLDSFRAIDNIHLRKHRMDLHIKCYERAFTNLLAYLHDSNDKNATKEQLIELVVSKRIYKHAIKTCSGEFVDFVRLDSGQCGVEPTFNELCVEVWSKYGDYLLEKRYYLEAGLAYQQAMQTYRPSSEIDEKIMDNAVKCFLLADDWQRCLAVVERSRPTESKRMEIIQKVVKSLRSQGDSTNSVLVTQLQKDDEAAFWLVSAKRWHLAETLVTDTSRAELHKQLGDKMSAELYGFVSDLSTEMNDARGHYARLKELFLTPQANQRYDFGDCVNADTLSTVDGSETTSVSLSASMLSKSKTARSGAPSIKTRASSKASKSQARKKKVQLRKGSRHEDMALVKELQMFIKNQKSWQDSVRHLLAAQVEFRMRPSTPLLNSLLTERHELAHDILNALWPQGDMEDSVFSVYKRFSKLFASGETLDNDDVSLLLRPDFSASLDLFDL